MIYKTDFDFWEVVDKGLPLVNTRYNIGDTTFAYWPSEAAAYKEVDNYGKILIGKGCKRRVWYRYKGIPFSDPMLAEGYYKAMMGKVCESFIFEAISKMGILIGHNIKFYNKRYNISGEVDAIVTKPNGNKCIIELKTFDGYYAAKNIMGYWDSRGKDRKWIQGQPKDDHLLQAFLYDILNQDPSIDYAKIVYLARDTVVKAQFDISHANIHGTLYPVVNGVPRLDIDGSKMMERYELYNLMISQDTVPDRDFTLQYDAQDIENRFKAGLILKTAYEKYKTDGDTLGDWNCSYCPYKSYCFKLKGDK